MSAGTIDLLNGNVNVIGHSTSFTTELTAGAFITTVVGGVPYTVSVAEVVNDTGLRLTAPWDGPTANGQAWDASAVNTMALATMGVTTQAQRALRMLFADSTNWRLIYSNAQSVTVTLPNGQTYTGPSWGYMAGVLASLGNSSSRDVGTTAGTVAAGDDSRLNTIDGKTGGVVTGNVLASTGQAVGVQTGSGGNKAIVLSNVTSDGPTEAYVNWLSGRYYNGEWRMGAIRGQGTDLARVQLNVYDGVSSTGDFRWHPYGAFQCKTHIGPGEGYGGGYQDFVNGFSTNTSFSRPNLSTPNDGGYVPALRWHNYCSGGYHAVTALGSLSGGPAAWPSIELVTIGDGGSSGTRISSFSTTTADLTATGSGSFGGNYIFSKSPTSDATLKHDITYTDGQTSVDNIKAMKPSTFVYNADESGTVRRGLIAQDVQAIDPEYVHSVPGGVIIAEDGTETKGPDTLALDSNVLLLDAVLALNNALHKIDELVARVTGLEAEVAELKRDKGGLIDIDL